jgi:sec-independent protein translocase protein TatB
LSGIGFWELVVLFVIGLLILGPERLPRVATQIGRWVGRARRTANQLRYQIEREIALADIEKKNKDRNEAKREDDSTARSDEQQPGQGQDQAQPESAADGEPEAELSASEQPAKEADAEDRNPS